MAAEERGWGGGARAPIPHRSPDPSGGAGRRALSILFLPGDGIGPEIAEATIEILRHVNDQDRLGLAVHVEPVGLAALRSCGTTLPERVAQSAREADGIILAPLSTYEYPAREAGGLNPSHEFRTGLDLYANFRPCVQRIWRPHERNPADLVIVRENTEGFYASRAMHKGTGEFMPDPDTAFAVRKITARASRRIAVAAFEIAEQRRRKVTAVHKANVLKLSDGLFLETVREVAKDFPSVELEEVLVDAAAALLIRDIGRLDVVLTTNMFGDILSNEAAELCGGLGMAPSLNAGDRTAMAQAAHGSAPDIAGKGIANPTGLILSCAMLLDWLGRRHDRRDLICAARRLTTAVDLTLSSPSTRTRDLGGTLGTAAFAEIVAKNFGTEVRNAARLEFA